MSYNTAAQTFPGSIVANLFGFREKEYFPMEDVAREPVKVDF